MVKPAISVSIEAADTVLHLSGRMVTNEVHVVEPAFNQIAITTKTATFDLSGVEALDTAGACLITGLQQRLANAGIATQIQHANKHRAKLIDAVAEARAAAPHDPVNKTHWSDWIASLGQRTAGSWRAAKSFLGFLGLVVARLIRTVVFPRRLRTAALFSQMQQTGFNAIPIVALMGFLIGIVLAYQGAAQLQQFGAEVFVVDLIAVSVLRELGILLTAIIVAGRSGSAYAAAIGSMKIHEEIDAMRTLGLDPIEVLVLPRVVALVLMLPVLGLVANLAALIGGALMSWVELGVSPDMFITRFRENTDVWHLLVGMIKAPVFAFIIALVACWQGLQVAASADSVGQRTRASVVQAIFLVIVMDAVFSIFFAELGV